MVQSGSEASTIATAIDARRRELGGLSVLRVLPALGRRTVGPFIFLDHMGPARLDAGRGIDVRPHPHIGLATVTYLFEGELVHRDSLGSEQAIRPGDVNWMTAGQGIVHSERTAAEQRRAASTLHGLQLWVALPAADEEGAPSFHHHPGATLPEVARGGVRLRVLAGSAYGATSPIATRSPLFYVTADLPGGAELALPDEHVERALYVVDGAVAAGGARAEAGRMLVFPPGAPITAHAIAASRVALIGGAPLDGPRHIFWNFVSSSRDRLEQAKRDWRDHRFPSIPGDDTDLVPLPV
ncbi:MAG TPA: pirin family protein [Kofleriaceae bacterium]|nr:pirin family protein [Kofleriaceae bacterium]